MAGEAEAVWEEEATTLPTSATPPLTLPLPLAPVLPGGATVVAPDAASSPSSPRSSAFGHRPLDPNAHGGTTASPLREGLGNADGGPPLLQHGIFLSHAAYRSFCACGCALLLETV